MARALGIRGLGLDPASRRLFRRATNTGALNEFFANRPETASAFNARITGTSVPPRLQRRAQRSATRGGFDINAVLGTDAMGGADATSAPPVPQTPTTVPGYEDLIKKYGGDVGDVTRNAQRYIDAQIGRYSNPMEMPSFEDMFSNYLNVANRETERQASGLHEAFGSRGGRYSSDLLNTEQNLRSQFHDINLTKGDELMRGLEGLRQQGQGTLLNAATAVANIAEGTRNQAAQRMFLDSLRQTGLPPELQQAIAAALNLGGPDNIAYTG